MSYKTTDGLMRHLRNNGIAISGSRQKRQLLNTGYFHGYKGYRFFGKSRNRIPFSSYDEVNATIQYDANLKMLFYGKVMYIETAVKNIALQSILSYTNSESIQTMLEVVVSSYKNAPKKFSEEQKKKLQQNKLNLHNSIQANLATAYRKENPQITHFYNNASYQGVPIWALFEILMLGDFGYLLSCLTYDVRDDISKKLGINVSFDTNRQLIYKYIYALKDLRNAIAHNLVVFDTRFRNIEPTKAMQKCLIHEVGVSYINFESIGDYVILICYYLKLLHVSKTEIKAFIREFERITKEYENSVEPRIAAIVIHPKLKKRMEILKKYI